MYKYLGNTQISTYTFLGTLGFFVLLIFNFLNFSKKKNFLGKASTKFVLFLEEKRGKNYKVQAICSEILIISIIQYAFTGDINKFFGNFFKDSYNYFGLLYITPVLLTIACIVLGINLFKQIDLIAPAFPLALIFSKLACFCNGCCDGIQCSFGLYFPADNAVEFPSQLLEAGTALIIFIFLLFWRKKAKEGTMFPTYLIIYSFTRFFIEFTKASKHIWGPFNLYHFLCVSGVIIGIIELIILKKYKEKIQYYCDNSHEAISTRLYNYALKNGIIKNKNIVHHKKRKKHK